MSFRCDRCDVAQEPLAIPIRDVTKTRSRTYNNYGKTSYGWEIVKEQFICLECAENE